MKAMGPSVCKDGSQEALGRIPSSNPSKSKANRNTFSIVPLL